MLKSHSYLFIYLFASLGFELRTLLLLEPLSQPKGVAFLDFFLVVLGMETGALHMLNLATTEPHFQPS
jgi:hypothetical protein